MLTGTAETLLPLDALLGLPPCPKTIEIGDARTNVRVKHTRTNNKASFILKISWELFLKCLFQNISQIACQNENNSGLDQNASD